MSRNLVLSFFKHVQEHGVLSALWATSNYLTNNLLPIIKRSISLCILRLRYGNWEIIEEINGSRMYLDIRPFGPNKIERTLALEGIREPGATELLKTALGEMLKERSTVHVFDIGANIGYFALLESHVLGECGDIVAIEADPNNTKRLEQNIELNDYTNIDVLQIAAGAEQTELQLGLREKSNIHQMTEVLEDSSAEKIDVQVKPIDQLAQERGISSDELAIIRMDVEGYESHVIEGMEEMLDSDQPMYVMMEIHPKSVDLQNIIEPFRENGFETEYVSYDGGNSFEGLDSFDDIHIEDTNSHLVVKRVN